MLMTWILLVFALPWKNKTPNSTHVPELLQIHMWSMSIALKNNLWEVLLPSWKALIWNRPWCWVQHQQSNTLQPEKPWCRGSQGPVKQVPVHKNILENSQIQLSHSPNLLLMVLEEVNAAIEHYVSIDVKSSQQLWGAFKWCCSDTIILWNQGRRGKKSSLVILSNIVTASTLKAWCWGGGRVEGLI